MTGVVFIMKKLLLGILGIFLLTVTFANACSSDFWENINTQEQFLQYVQTCNACGWTCEGCDLSCGVCDGSCEGCGCDNPDIPEFGTIAAGVAVLGSGIGFVALRKRK